MIIITTIQCQPEEKCVCGLTDNLLHCTEHTLGISEVNDRQNN